MGNVPTNYACCSAVICWAGGRSLLRARSARHCPRTPYVGVLGSSVCVLRCFPLCGGVALPMMTRAPCARRFGRPPSVALPLRFAPVGAALCALKLCVCFLSCCRVVHRLQFFGVLIRLSTVKCTLRAVDSRIRPPVIFDTEHARWMFAAVLYPIHPPAPQGGRSSQ